MPNKSPNKAPAYLRIKTAILDNIHTGIWASGVAIPAEITLAEDFGVSRMTVNRAIKELEAERVLERRQGSGTYVAQQKYNNAHIEVRNIAKDIRERFHHYHAQVITQKTLDFMALNQPDNHWLNTLFFTISLLTLINYTKFASHTMAMTCPFNMKNAGLMPLSLLILSIKILTSLIPAII